MFELTAPYVTGMLLLPLVAKARVMHTHSKNVLKGIRLAQLEKAEKVEKRAKYEKVEGEDDQADEKKEARNTVEFTGTMRDALAYV